MRSLLDSKVLNYRYTGLIKGFKLKIPAFLGLALLYILPAYGSDSPDIDYDAGSDFFGEAPVVLTVSRMHKPLDESPASVSIIDRQMIRDSGARQVADIFRMVPGFIVGYYTGNQPLVAYQGLGSLYQRQMQVLIDGRSVFIPSFGGIPWTNLPLLLEDIERVEITRGPNAVTYGANAFLATINIITRHAAEDAGSEVIMTQGFGKDNSVNDFYARYGNNYGDLDWRITAGREQDDGYENINDSRSMEKINIRTDFLSEYNQFWTIQAGLNQTTAGRGDGDVTNTIRDEETSNSYQNIKWEMVQDRSSTVAAITHTRQVVNDKYPTDPLNDFIADLTIGTSYESYAPFIRSSAPFYFTVDFDRRSDRLDFELYQTRKVSPSTQWVYGLSLREDEVVSIHLFNNDSIQRVDTQRLFSSVEWKSNNGYILDLGVMLEDSSYTDTETSYRISALKKAGQHTLRLVTSTANRNPILYELFGSTQYEVYIPPLSVSLPIVDWRVTGNVEPEKIKSTEIGIFSEYLNQQLTTDIKLFYYKVSDQIDEQYTELTPDPVTGTNQIIGDFVNAGNTVARGIDLSLNFSPERKDYRVFGGSSYVQVKESFDDYKESYPELTYYLGGHYNIADRQQISGVFYFVDSFSWTDSNRTMDAYRKLDLRYQYTIDQQHDLNLELIGRDLYETYSDYSPFRSHGESYLLRISGRF